MSNRRWIYCGVALAAIVAGNAVHIGPMGVALPIVVMLMGVAEEVYDLRTLLTRRYER